MWSARDEVLAQQFTHSRTFDDLHSALLVLVILQFAMSKRTADNDFKDDGAAKRLRLPTRSTSVVSDGTLDRQWDARVNVEKPGKLDELLGKISEEATNGKYSYILVSGVEIGGNPAHTDYMLKHVHIAAVFSNRVSKWSIVRNWGLGSGTGYYLVPRKRHLPVAGWIDHHKKADTKVNPEERVLFELGTPPKDSPEASAQVVQRSENEKKMTQAEVLVDMRRLIEKGKDGEDEAWAKYPLNYLRYGEKIKALVTHQHRGELASTGDPHIWVNGPAGCGKSAILAYVYPATFKKNLYNRFFDLFKPGVHTHVMLEDLDHEAVERLSTNFIKTLCDESGFPVDQKYKTPQLARATILVSSNFTLPQLIHQSTEANVFGKEANLKALQRRFWQVEGRELLRALGLKLISRYEIIQLKKQGNTDTGKLFMDWDYVNDTGTGLPIKTPAEYQAIIKELAYK